MARALVALLILAAPLASAQAIVCVSSTGNGLVYTDKWQTRCTKRSWPGEREFLKMHGFPCDGVGGAPACNPPATMIYRGSLHPFAVRVTFAGTEIDHGMTMWRWVGPTPTCTAADRERGPEYERACRAPLSFSSPRFFRTGQDGRGVE